MQDNLEAEETDIKQATDREQFLFRYAATEALPIESLQEFRDAVAELLLAEPNNPGVLTLSARGALVAGEIERGLEDIARALELAPDQWESLYVNGMLLYQAARHEEARLSLQKALQANPLSSLVHGGLGNVFVALGETRQAVEEYRAAINLDPEQPAYYLNLAIAYQKLGETELEAEAMENYRRLLRQQP